MNKNGNASEIEYENEIFEGGKSVDEIKTKGNNKQIKNAVDYTVEGCRKDRDMVSEMDQTPAHKKGKCMEIEN